MEPLILVINPGSTSTKIAVYRGEQGVHTETVEHPLEELERFARLAEQFDMRRGYVLDTLHKLGLAEQELDAVAARGGLLPPNQGGVYRVNRAMVDRLQNRPLVEHASNLGALIAYSISEPLGIASYICDPITTDELSDLARISGLPQIPRASKLHALNARAMARKAAAGLGLAYSDCNLIVAHLGGGVSYSAHEKGRIVDVVLDDEGSFSPQRAGGLPSSDLVELCYSGRYTAREARRLIRGEGGLKAYLGCIDAREVEERIRRGDGPARLVYEALAYQAAKSVAQLAVVFCGAVDGIVLTGGLSHSRMLTGWIEERVRFLAPVLILPGEMEMEALALGALRVLRGEEEPREYSEPGGE